MNIDVKRFYGPGGIVQYQYNGKNYNSLQDITNEISGRNPSVKYVTQYVTKNPYSVKSYGGFQNNGNKPYQSNGYGGNIYYRPGSSGGNNIYNGYGSGNPYNRPGQYGGNNLYDRGNNNGGYGSGISNNIFQRPYPSPSISNSPGTWGYIDEIWKRNWYDYDPYTDSSKGYPNWKYRALKEHNEYRAKHGVGSLTYDPNLEKKAEAYAKELSNYIQLRHDPRNDVDKTGENIGMTYKQSVNTMVRNWYEEVKKYDFKRIAYQSGCGHMTQIIWKSTLRVGCGIYELNAYKIFVVCKYSPRGNINGFFPTNVFKPRV
uniref:SCP domain-containing protein n=1 Tax=Strongyloides papillosus TaxID=174720 RepID=A0A0N5BBB1_STREA